MSRVLIVLLLGFLSTGCSTILAGTSQNITVATIPSGAKCDFVREGKTVGTVNPTPGAINLSRTKYDMNIICDKPGYQRTDFNAESGTESAVIGNLLAGGLIGWGIDSAVGADNKYPEVVNITLVPKP